MLAFLKWFRCRLFELMLLALYDFLKDKRSTPLFSGRMLLSLTVLSNFFLVYMLRPGAPFAPHPPSEKANAGGGWALSIAAVTLGYLLIYLLTSRIQFPERTHPTPALLRKGKWLVFWYVTASFCVLFTIMWRLTPA